MNPDRDRVRDLIAGADWKAKKERIVGHGAFPKAKSLACLVVDAAHAIFNSRVPSPYHYEEQDDDVLTVTFSWCAVDVGWPVEVPSIVQRPPVPGYRVWTAKWTGGTFEPPEMEDVTYAEVVSESEALDHVLGIFLRDRIVEFHNTRAVEAAELIMEA